MELLSVIRRWRYRDHFSIREISRRTGLSRNTVRKYLRSDTVEPKFNIPDRPSKLDPYADKLSQMLRQESGKSRKQKRTTKRPAATLAAARPCRGGASGLRPWFMQQTAPKSCAQYVTAMALAQPQRGPNKKRRPESRPLLARRLLSPPPIG